MTIVKYVDKKTGRVSVYESTPHYDPVSKQSRPRRKYLGTLDPETGELVPSSGRPGRRPGSKNRPKADGGARERRNDEETRTETKPQAPAAEAEERGDVRQEDSVLRERVAGLERRVAELERELGRRRDWERGLAEAAARPRG